MNHYDEIPNLASIPPVASKDFFTWRDDYVAYRTRLKDYYPQTEYYFSNSGDDYYGNGSPSAPFRTLAKAQTLLANSNVAVYFKGGETFVLPSSLMTDTMFTPSQGCLVGSYGGGKATLSAWNETWPSGGSRWVLASGNRYIATTPTIKYLRLANDPLNPLVYGTGSNQVQTTAYSFTVTGGTTHVNLGGLNPNNYAFEMTRMINPAFGLYYDGIVLRDVVVDGFGISYDANDSDLNSNINIGDLAGTNVEVLVENCDLYYGGTNLTIYCTNDNGRLCATINNCTAGFYTDANISWGVSATTPNEEVLINNFTDIAGNISVITNPLASGYLGNGVIRSSTASAKLNIVNNSTLTSKTKYRQIATKTPLTLLGGSSYIVNCSDSRGYPVAIPTIIGNVINSQFSLRYNTGDTLISPLGRGSGTFINTIFDIGIAPTGVSHTSLFASTDTLNLYNSHVKFSGHTNANFRLSANTDTGLRIHNNILQSYVANRFAALGSGNATVLRNNATYNILQTSASGLNLDAYQVILSAAPLTSTVPGTGSILYQSGTLTATITPQYDLVRNRRSPLFMTIGPRQEHYDAGQTVRSTYYQATETPPVNRKLLMGYNLSPAAAITKSQGQGNVSFVEKMVEKGEFNSQREGEFVLMGSATQIAGRNTTVLQSPGTRPNAPVQPTGVGTVRYFGSGYNYVTGEPLVTPVVQQDPIGVQNRAGIRIGLGKFFQNKTRG